jgi:hypothetical protein
MKKTSQPSTRNHLIRRAATIGLVATLALLAVPIAAGADVTADAAPTVTAVTATGGDVTVTWTNDAADATSIDVILYDDNGNVVEDDNVGAAATSDTMSGVADGGGYTIDVVANTPGGALDSGPSNAFDVYQGSITVDRRTHGHRRHRDGR